MSSRKESSNRGEKHRTQTYVDYSEEKEEEEKEKEEEEEKEQRQEVERSTATSSRVSSNPQHLQEEGGPTAETATERAASALSAEEEKACSQDPVITFPVKLYDLLSRVDKFGLGHVSYHHKTEN